MPRGPQEDLFVSCLPTLCAWQELGLPSSPRKEEGMEGETGLLEPGNEVESKKQRREKMRVRGVYRAASVAWNFPGMASYPQGRHRL